ncbi:Ferredoxin subunit of nitrite reductase or a ring-hydroxylating dioxygenase [Haladaptatus litoreus]|uniref:Ferredoxin subunit of nitrite reductase or a ring-hydroxylating dioxygenase n=1 Tax=Haladaptatus litoreus TaxID=553468 RepID=A0A1N7DWA2_9EURY|nr:Rieske (2Fe-2S) protein [Haladaptatus litoreus]SIR80068.1 Ferredoxin subunit of nitrite reductase or a ring-hydroxylating dioxygenase [Haladaptatus litoreus]
MATDETGDSTKPGTDQSFVRVADADELREEGRLLVNRNGRSLALFYHEGEFRAVDNRCPHMGFPLTEGSVEDGILTCHWHHARFELSCGDTFDPWADDVQAFPIEERDGDIYVNTTPKRDAPPEEHWTERLETGLEENLRLVVAKSVIGLSNADVPDSEPLRIGAAFGTRYREQGWSSGLTIHSCMANVLPDLGADDRPRALYTGLRHVASDCQGESPRFDQPSFETEEVPADRLRKWFRDCVEVRDRDGAERCLQTAIATLEPEQVAEILYTAATDHLYLDAGHSFDFINKSLELLDHIGWEHAETVLPSVIPRLTDAQRSEELSSWTQPIDLAELLFDSFDQLPELVEAGNEKTWNEPDDFTEILLSDDPHEILNALKDAIRSGATCEELADRVSFASLMRVAQFGTANEFSDWNTVHHTLTYNNAVQQAAKRASSTALYRGVLAGAMSVYLDRFLNTPPTPVPTIDSSDANPEDLREELLETFDEEGNVNAAGAIVAEHFSAGGDPGKLKETLGQALLREDAGFHTLQNLEASFAQFDLRDDEEEKELALISLARYMGAHFPTRREAEQTYVIADRLNRGEKIHESN